MKIANEEQVEIFKEFQRRMLMKKIDVFDVFKISQDVLKELNLKLPLSKKDYIKEILKKSA